MKFLLVTFCAATIIMELQTTFLENYRQANATCTQEANQRKCRKKCIADNLNYTNKEGNLIIKKFPTQIRPLLANCTKILQSEKPCARIDKMRDCIKSQGRTYAISQLSQCSAETNATVTLFTVLSIYPDALYDDGMACFHRCLGLKNKVIDRKGEFSLEEYDAGMKEYKVDFKKMREDCARGHNQSDVCVRSTKRMLCLGEALEREQSKFDELKVIV